MDSRIVTLDSAHLVPLPSETAQEVGLRAGSRLAVSVKDGTILLQPLLADNLEQLRGIFSSSADLVDELQKEWRKDKW